eukprot:15366287-Ditylum_brightwellii.AAC.1
MHIPSGVDIHKKFQWRVSTEKDEFVISFPMSPFLSCSSYTFKELMRDIGMFKGMNDEQNKLVLQNHPKTITRVNLVKKMKGNNSTKHFTSHQRIKLPHCVQATPISQLEDKIFYNVKYAANKDSSVFMHAELMVGTGDNYTPEEWMLDEVLMRSNIITPTKNLGSSLTPFPSAMQEGQSANIKKNILLTEIISLLHQGCPKRVVCNFQTATIVPSHFQPHMMQCQMMQQQMMQLLVTQQQILQNQVLQEQMMMANQPMLQQTQQ